MKKVVIIADIVKSRKITNRGKVQGELVTVFKGINKNPDIISPYTITLGDEFQAVYSKADSIFKDICKIIVAVYPVHIRFSIGIGEINTKINTKQALGMDGPAFYNARNGLEKLKDTEYLLEVTTGNNGNSLLLSEVLHLISHNFKGWKGNRLAILTLLMAKLPPRQIAKKLKLTEQAVYKNISAGILYTVISLFDQVGRHINKILRISA